MEHIFKGSKSQVQTKLEGLGMFDKEFDLANTKQIKEYALMYSKLYDLVPSEKLCTGSNYNFSVR